jgi:hyperosmotically inducible protein
MRTPNTYLAAAAASILLTALIGCSHEPEHGSYSSTDTSTTSGTASTAGATTTSGTSTQAVDDVTITNNVQAALANAPGVNGSQVNVQTSDGVVTLSGDVDSSASASAAVSAAQGVNGVSSVKNDLNVTPTPPQK